jgi:hypothetical protein
LRHSYAKWRLQILREVLQESHQKNSLRVNEEQALYVLSQELGHFRKDITCCYIR